MIFGGSVVVVLFNWEELESSWIPHDHRQALGFAVCDSS